MLSETSSSFPFRILLIGNYRLDGQMSMLHYHDLLLREFRSRSVPVSSIEPGALLGAIHAGPLTKWLRYVDKYLLFPFWLRTRIRQENGRLSTGQRLIVHITDHSNSPYLRHVTGAIIVATCHDLLAVRGALGEDTDCPASGFGKILQRQILDGLQKMDHVFCVSGATENDLRRLAPGVSSEVIPLPLNQPYGILRSGRADELLHAYAPALFSQEFILHVGSSLRRKNREGILRTFARIAPQWPGRLVFAGEKLPPGLHALAAELGIASRIVELTSPPGPVLEALYNRAHCLFFPSKTEGFGWPIIEAQACGCPVLIARTTSLPEVAGKGALIRDLTDEAGFAEDLLKLDSKTFRSALIKKGLANLRRFETPGIIARYLATYEKLSQPAKTPRR